jgi:hypothetical protein
MNTFKTLTLTAAILVGSIGSSQASFFNNYNAQLNSPVGKQEFLDRTCRGTDVGSINLCEYMKSNGVHDSDARHGAIAVGLVLGGAAGMVAASVPVAALGGKTLIGQWGVTSVLGLAPTVAVVGTTGAVLGTALAAGVAYTN